MGDAVRMKSIVRPNRRSGLLDVDPSVIVVESPPDRRTDRNESPTSDVRAGKRVTPLTTAQRDRKVRPRKPVRTATAAGTVEIEPTPVADKVVNGLISLASFIAWLIPMPFWTGLTLFGGLIGMCGPTRRTVLANIDHALLGDPPDRWRSWWIGCQQIATHLRTVVMLLRSGTTRSRRRGRLDFNERQHLLPYLNKRGIVVVGPHAGPYPLLGFLALPWLRNEGFTGEVVIVARLFRPFRSGAVMDWFIATFARAGTTILPIDTPPRTLALRLRRTLANNGAVVLLVDEPTAFAALPVPLFDDEIDMPAGPARLAHATGSIIIPGIARYERRRTMSVTFGPPIEPVASASATLAAVARALEPMIRSNLSQWTMLTPIWKKPVPFDPNQRQGRADLHLHTPGSDGLVTVDEWRQAAAQHGIDVIAITDHDSLATIHAWQRADGNLPSDEPVAAVSVIPGVELTARGRAVHVGVLFGGLIPDEIPPAGSRLPDIVRWARGIPDALVILVHPLPVIWRWQIKGLSRQGLLPDAIETRYPFVNGKTQTLERTARRLGIATLGSSDAHLHPEHLGINLTAFDGRTTADLFRAIRRQETTALALHRACRLPSAVARYQALSSWVLPLCWFPGVIGLNRSLLLRSRLATGRGPFPIVPDEPSRSGISGDSVAERTAVHPPADLALR